MVVIFCAFCLKCLCGGNFLPSNLETAVSRTFGRNLIRLSMVFFFGTDSVCQMGRASMKRRGMEEDHLALWVPYVSTTQAGTAAIPCGARRVLSSLIYRRECDTIPRVSDTIDASARYARNLPMIQIPPVSFPLTASQIARYIDVKSCVILESLL